MAVKVYIPGMVFGRLTLIEEKKKGKKNYWKTKCQCGNYQYYRTDYISQMKCMGRKFECAECKYKRRCPPLDGKKFGRLTVIKKVQPHGKDSAWLVRCDCGVEKEIITSALNRGTKSCGCLARKLHSKWVNTTQYPPAHQLRAKNTEQSLSGLYNCRNSCVAGCYNPKNARYATHGALGHTVCDLWRNGAKDFVKWAIENGYKKGDGIYIKEGQTVFSPTTCYIMKKSEYAEKNNSKPITYKGKTQAQGQWAEELGCTQSCLSARLQRYRHYGIDKIMDLSWVAEKNQKYGTEHLEEDIVCLYQKGHSYEEIRKELGCESSTIKRFLKKNNISPRKAERRSAQIIKEKLPIVHEMKMKGKSMREVAEIFGINEHNLFYNYRNYLKKLKI